MLYAFMLNIHSCLLLYIILLLHINVDQIAARDNGLRENNVPKNPSCNHFFYKCKITLIMILYTHVHAHLLILQNDVSVLVSILV